MPGPRVIRVDSRVHVPRGRSSGRTGRGKRGVRRRRTTSQGVDPLHVVAGAPGTGGGSARAREGDRGVDHAGQRAAPHPGPILVAGEVVDVVEVVLDLPVLRIQGEDLGGSGAGGAKRGEASGDIGGGFPSGPPFGGGRCGTPNGALVGARGRRSAPRSARGPCRRCVRYGAASNVSGRRRRRPASGAGRTCRRWLGRPLAGGGPRRSRGRPGLARPGRCRRGCGAGSTARAV